MNIMSTVTQLVPNAVKWPFQLFGGVGLGAWYDPSDLSTLFQDSAGTTPVTADGQPVGLMKDKSGLNNHASQAVGANRPTYKTDGKLHWLEFNGTSHALATATLNLSSANYASLFVAIYTPSNSGGRIVAEYSVDTGLNTGSFYMASPENPDTVTSAARGSAALVAGHIAKSGTLTVPATMVATALHNISGDSSQVRVNGVLRNTATSDKGTGSFGSYPLYIGARAAASTFFSGRLYGLVLSNQNVTASQLAAVEQYLARMSGIAF